MMNRKHLSQVFSEAVRGALTSSGVSLCSHVAAEEAAVFKGKIHKTGSCQRFIKSFGLVATNEIVL